MAFFVAEGGGDGAKFLIVLGSGEAEDVLREAGEHEVIGVFQSTETKSLP